MRKRAKIVAAASLLLAGALIVVTYVVPKSCFTSPDGKVSYGDWARHVFRLDFQECDPFAQSHSKLPIGEISISYGFENAAAPDVIELSIEPDGMARISRGLGSEDHVAIRLTRSDYLYFRNRLAPLRDYSRTRIHDRPEPSLFKGGSRPEIACDSSFSLHPNGVFIVWDMGAESGSANALPELVLSSFDLGCEGPAGPALRQRLEPIIDRLFTLDQKWGRQPYHPVRR